jgi:predicted alpha/beta superfamily hydrolase
MHHIVLGLMFVLAIATARAAETEPLVIGETFTLPSKVMNETRRINVYRPPLPDSARDTPLPVLYMLDGGIKEDFLHIAGLVQVSVGNGTMRPLLLIGIENTERRRDMTGPTENPEDKKIAPRVGGSATFRAFIAKELMPEIARRYRVTDESAIIGESAAGLFIVETLFLEPALFDTYIAVDPSLWWNNEDLVKKAEPRLVKMKTVRATLFLTSSGDGNAKPAEALADAMHKQAPKTLQFIYEPMPGEQHATIFHPAALRAFRTLFKPEEVKK